MTSSNGIIPDGVEPARRYGSHFADPDVAVKSPAFYPRLEALRGLAAASVVIFHAFQSQAGLNDRLWDSMGWPQAIAYFATESIFNGGAAVVLFFVLSGFVMGVNVDTKSPLSLRLYFTFMVKRAFRLYPVIMLSVLLACAIAVVARDTVIRTDDLWRYLSLADTSINGPLWSVRVEIIVSLFYLPALFMFASTPFMLKAALLLLCVTSYIAGYQIEPIAPYTTAFCLGILIPSLGHCMVRGLGQKTTTAFLPLVFLGLYASSTVLGIFGVFTGGVIIQMTAFGSAYLIAAFMYAGSSGGFYRLLDHKLSLWLGRVSYSLYALHYPILMLIAEWVAHTFPELSFFGRATLVLILAGPASLFAAALSFRLVEMPFMRAGKVISGWGGAKAPAQRNGR